MVGSTNFLTNGLCIMPLLPFGRERCLPTAALRTPTLKTSQLEVVSMRSCAWYQAYLFSKHTSTLVIFWESSEAQRDEKNYD